MNCAARLRVILAAYATFGLTPFIRGDSASDYAVQVSAGVQTVPPEIVLSWPADGLATEYTLSRKTRDDLAWGSSISLAGNISSYTDTNVVVGGAYEYRVTKSTSSYYSEGYIYAGIDVPQVEERGKVIVVVDKTFSSSLASELKRLQQDLAGDGWVVLRHDVERMAIDPGNESSNVWAARSNELARVKTLIMADYYADTNNVKAVFLFGHVPVPYSGDVAPDDHIDHLGAWPADAYYADPEDWTDTSTVDAGGSMARNWNLIGDGKLDLSLLTSDAKLQIGRVDLANLPAFPQSEQELLRQYLDKDHRFRHAQISAQRRGWVDDHLGLSSGEASAVNAWRNFAPFFGHSNIYSGLDWFGRLSTNSYLWGYGCGAGTYTGCGGVGSAADFATSDPRVVFCMFFGSYFGDWDTQNNFLRAALTTTNYTLTSVWAARPNWMFHHMALGETIGFSTRVTQNNHILYDYNVGYRGVHVALMGDPTLRMHPVAPPASFTVTSNSIAGVDLAWSPSPDRVLGYHVYRATDINGPFTRITPTLLTNTFYSDPVLSSNVYMVRAIKLEVSGSGTYYNASQGIFQDLNSDFGPPLLTITAQNTNKVYGAPLPVFTALYSGFTNGDTPASLSAAPVLSTPATEASPPGDYPIQVGGAIDTNYILRFVAGTLRISQATTAGAVTSSINPALPTEPVSFNFFPSVLAPGQGTPTGTVQFKIDGVYAGGPVPIAGGKATYVTASLAHGFHSVVAEYAGDANSTGSTNQLSPDQLINTPPVAGGYTVERDPTNGVQISISVLLSNGSDPDSDAIALFSLSAASANGGTVVSNGDWISYTPAPGFTNSDTFTYTITDSLGGRATGTVVINIRPDIGKRPTLALTDLHNGFFLLRGEGTPRLAYSIQSTLDVTQTNWQTIGTAPANAFGIFEFTNFNGSIQGFYRSVYP